MEGGTEKSSLERRVGPQCDNTDNCDAMEALMSMIETIPDLQECSNENKMIVYDMKLGFSFGVVRINDKCYEVFSSQNSSRVIVADLKSHEMREYDKNRNETELDSDSIIDLNSNGRRWEGGVRNGKPYGYGGVFDEEGRKKYEGFMRKGTKCCYGIEYYEDINRIQYEGCYAYGQRVGKGILYDRKGGIEYDGLWKNGKPYSPEFDGRTIDNHIESIEITNTRYETIQLSFLSRCLHSLKRIVIGDECFGSVDLLRLGGLSELESIMIGGKSFESCDSYGDCRIVNCPKLKSIQIGFDSFTDYHSFELNTLPSLQSIDIGKYCFYWVPSFSLTGLID